MTSIDGGAPSSAPAAEQPPRGPGRGAAVRRAAAAACDDWGLHQGRIEHRTGRFFSIIAIDDGGHERLLIDQPEVGTLAFLATRQGAGTELLVQWKAEPGNVGLVQAAPTVQATRSNIERAHGGLPTPLLDEVLDPEGRMADTLGSEQAERFLAKRNRNLTRGVHPDDAARLTIDPERHEWMSAAAVRRMLRADFRINTDARSVIASTPWDSLLAPGDDPLPLLGAAGFPEGAIRRSLSDADQRRLDKHRGLLRRHRRDRPSSTIIPLDRLSSHRFVDDGIIDTSGGRAVGWFDVTLPSREVGRWCQPLLEQPYDAICTLALTVEDGQVLAGLRPTVGPGWTDAEFAPTFQTDPTTGTANGPDLTSEPPLIAVRQSDEGGRFYAAIVDYRIVHVPAGVTRLGDGVEWVRLAELEALARAGLSTTNELRTCTSLLLALGGDG